MIKLLAIACILGQTIAAPGMGPMMNPWASQWMMAGMMPPWMAPPPATATAADAAVAPAPAPSSPIPPIAGSMKQMGFSFAIIGSKSKAAQKECQAEINKVKARCVGATDLCCTHAVDLCTLLEKGLKAEFKKCKMSKDIMAMHFPGKTSKTKQDKLKDIACMMNPANCDPAPVDPAAPAVPTFAEVDAKAEDCANNTKADQSAIIEAIDDDLTDCLIGAV